MRGRGVESFVFGRVGREGAREAFWGSARARGRHFGDRRGREGGILEIGAGAREGGILGIGAGMTRQ